MKTLPDSHPQQCCERIWRSTHFWDRGHRCARKASVVHDGKPYCKQHDPARRQVTKDRNHRKHEAEVAYRATRAALIAAAKLAIEDERVPTALTDAVSAFEAAEAECREVGVEMWRLY